jgi:hypothetical protein
LYKKKKREMLARIRKRIKSPDSETKSWAKGENKSATSSTSVEDPRKVDFREWSQLKE